MRSCFRYPDDHRATRQSHVIDGTLDQPPAEARQLGPQPEDRRALARDGYMIVIGVWIDWKQALAAVGKKRQKSLMN